MFLACLTVQQTAPMRNRRSGCTSLLLPLVNLSWRFSAQLRIAEKITNLSYEQKRSSGAFTLQTPNSDNILLVLVTPWSGPSGMMLAYPPVLHIVASTRRPSGTCLDSGITPHKQPRHTDDVTRHIPTYSNVCENLLIISWDVVVWKLHYTVSSGSIFRQSSGT